MADKCDKCICSFREWLSLEWTSGNHLIQTPAQRRFRTCSSKPDSLWLSARMKTNGLSRKPVTGTTLTWKKIFKCNFLFSVCAHCLFSCLWVLLRRAWVSCLYSLLAGIYTLWYDHSNPSFIHVKQVQCAWHLLSVRCTGLLIIFMPRHWTVHSVPCFSHTGRSRSGPSTSSVSCQCWVEGKCHLIFLAVLSLIEHRKLSPFFAVWEHCWLKGQIVHQDLSSFYARLLSNLSAPSVYWCLEFFFPGTGLHVSLSWTSWDSL